VLEIIKFPEEEEDGDDDKEEDKDDDLDNDEDDGDDDDEEEGFNTDNNVNSQGVQSIPVSPLRLVASTVIVLAVEFTTRTTPVMY
jgi:hypothetical protein